jgi:hypothetical protein
MCLPAIASGQSVPAERLYDDCIVRYAAKAPSPQAATILQRACFFKHLYGRDYVTRYGLDAEYRKLARIYTPAVCDCIFKNMPAAPLNVPAARVLDGCVEASKKPSGPIAK